jgi:hypothetical protein
MGGVEAENDEVRAHLSRYVDEAARADNQGDFTAAEMFRGLP